MMKTGVFVLMVVFGFSAHAQTLIPNLTPATALTGTELFPIVQGSPPAVSTSTNGIGTFLSKTTIQRPGIRVQAFGDSEDNACTSYANANTGYGTNVPVDLYEGLCELVWANRLLGAQLNFDTTKGYGPAFYNQGPLKIVISSPGNYSVAPTGATLAGATLAAPVMSGSGVASIAITAATATCTTGAAVTLTGGTGTAATAYALCGTGGTISAVGATTTQMTNYVADAVAAPVDVIFMHGGTNDVATSVALSTIEANLTSIWQQIMASGKTVVYFSPAPRSQVSGFTATQQLVLYNLTQWARSYINGQSSKRPSNYGNILFIDREPECTDNTSSTGAWLAICSDDGLHLSEGGAYIMGYKLAQSFKPLIGNFGQYFSTSLTDLYNASNNPGGILNGVEAFFTTGGGTATSPCTGTVNGSWSLTRLSGSATGTPCAASIETSRPDGFSGNRQVITTSLGSGTSTEEFSLLSTISTASLNVTPGVDNLQVTLYLEMSGMVNFNFLDVKAICQDSGFDSLAVTEDGGNPGDLLPASTALYGPSASAPFTLKTPPIVCPVSTTQVSIEFLFGYNGSGGAASATGVLKMTNFSIRKVQ